MIKSNSFLKNEKGFLTLDFMFAFMMIVGFTTILYSFAFTLSVVEMVQYIGFASARTYSLAHSSETIQKDRAELKFNELSGSTALKSFISAGWFQIGEIQISDFNDEYPTNADSDSANFIGVRIPFSAPVLYKRIPLLGTTGTDPEAFATNINAFLAREPTFQECQAFTQQREGAISALGYTADGVSAQMDNGC